MNLSKEKKQELEKKLECIQEHQATQQIPRYKQPHDRIKTQYRSGRAKMIKLGKIQRICYNLVKNRNIPLTTQMLVSKDPKLIASSASAVISALRKEVPEDFTDIIDAYGKKKFIYNGADDYQVVYEIYKAHQRRRQNQKPTKSAPQSQPQSQPQLQSQPQQSITTITLDELQKYCKANHIKIIIELGG
ncbi:MAG: hypothetical protein RBT65_19550 [Methanolobus sp.]|nr:hypothetical protein [Methanolobus sp.]